MRPRFALLAAIVAMLFLATTALAQDNVMRNDEFSVSLTRPEGWDVAEGNDRAIFNIKHEESQSQIEVIATELMSVDVAEVFYDTFHETLEQSQFTRETSQDQEIGGHAGKITEYGFEYAGVSLKVVIFQFTQESTAYLVVGYIKADEYEQHRASFEAAVTSLAFDS